MEHINIIPAQINNQNSYISFNQWRNTTVLSLEGHIAQGACAPDRRRIAPLHC